ncbi:MAG: NAD(P)-dependent oxidoreductase [Nitrospinota bacterium]
METKPNILVLGNGGFIGTALYNHLKKEKECEVRGVNSSSMNLTSPESISKIENIVDENTVIVFLARAPRNQDPLTTFEQDILITCNVARLIKKKSLKKFLYFSSTSVYGDGETNLCINENTKRAPTSYYGISKLVSEEILQKVCQENGISIVILRPCMIYGPGNNERPYGPDRLIYSIINQGQLELIGDGTDLRDYLFLEDLVRILEKFIFYPSQGIYNLASDDSVSMLYISEILREISKKDFPIIKLERNRPKIDQKLDISKLLSFYPDFKFSPLKKGLRKSYEFFLLNQNLNKMGTVK